MFIINRLRFLVFLLAFLILSPGIVKGEKLQHIRIAVKEFPPLVMAGTKGLCIDMAKVICERNGLVPEFVFYNNVPEFLAAVANNETNLGFSGISITADREKFVDFSQPFFDSGLIIAVHGNHAQKLVRFPTVVMRVIGFSLVIFLVGLSIVAHIIWWLEKDDENSLAFSTKYKEGIVDAYWWAVVTMTTVGYGDKCPRKISGRLVAAVWMIIGIMWFAAFTATLSTVLTLNQLQPGNIRSIADLDQRRVALIEGTTTENYLRYYNIKMVLSGSLEEMITLLKNDQVDAVIYDAPPLQYRAKSDPEIQVVGDLFAEQRYGVVFPEEGDDRLKEIFNREIINMQQNGEFQKIYDKWL